MLNFNNMIILAPMVRICTLPMRLLALDYGADIVYSEEIIDHKMLQCEIIKNDLFDTTDFVMPDGTLVFRTCSKEKNSVVFQVGTSDADRALQVANMVKSHVACFDVNMGCPKEFSIKGGMGAALMTNSEKAKEILTKLVKNIDIPVSCKSRILDSVEGMIEFSRIVESCGISCFAIHGRTRHEHPQNPNHDDVIAAVAKVLKIPVIASGGSNHISSYEDIDKFKKSTGCNSIMLGRAAQWNASIFSKSGLQSIDDVIKKYITYCVDYDNHLSNSKYCIQQFLHSNLNSEIGQKLLAANSIREICCIWQMQSYYDEMAMKIENKKKLLDSAKVQYVISETENGMQLIEFPFKYNRRDFEGSKSPKMVLHEWAIRLKFVPAYNIVENNETRLFRCILSLNSDQYTSTLWDKSKKNAEQASACVCLKLLKEKFEKSLQSEKPLFTHSPPNIPYRNDESRSKMSKQL